MPAIPAYPIPDWLRNEVEAYFIPFGFEPLTVLDIGANIGAFTQRAAKQWPQARFVCCEPMPFNVVQLRWNVPLGTKIISAAVRNFSGIDNIFVGDNFATGGFVQFGRQTNQQLLVECIASSRLPPCELVKIDTEGCEVEILRGLDLSKTKAILLEYHSREDAKFIQSFLSGNFVQRNSESEDQIGTYIFIRRTG